MPRPKTASRDAADAEERNVRIDEILSRVRYHRAQADALMQQAKHAKAEADRLKRRTRRKAR